MTHEIGIYSAHLLNALKEHHPKHAISCMRQMIEHFSREKVVKEIASLLNQTKEKKILLNGIPEQNKFALLMESCNQKNKLALDFLLLSYPINKMQPLEFSKFIAFMINNGFEIKSYLLQRNSEELFKEMNKALFYTIQINNKNLWGDPLIMANVSLLFEFGANLCPHVMELLKNIKALDHLLYILVYDKQDIDLNLVKKLIQAGANVFAKNIKISFKTIYEYLQDQSRDLIWLWDQAKPEQLTYLIEANIINDGNLIFLLEYGIQHAKHELVAAIISESKRLSQDKIIDGIHFLLDEKTENPLRFQHIKFLRWMHLASLSDEEKKQKVAPLLFIQIHKAKSIGELMLIVDLLKSSKLDFKYLTSTPDMLKIAVKAIVYRMKEIAIIERQITFPDEISHQKMLAFLKGVSNHGLYAKHDLDFNVLVKGKVVIAEKCACEQKNTI